VRRGFHSPERFAARHALEHEIETTAGLEFACQPLMTRLQAFLRQRQAAIAVLAVDLKHRTHSLTRLRIGLAAPSGDIAHLRGLLTERLATLALPAPVIAIRMRSGALLEQVQTTGSFRDFAPSPRPGERVGVRHSCDADALPRLIERLRARLGNDAVFGVGEVEDHRPERAWRVIEMPSPQPSPQPSPTSGRGSGGGKRPLWLLAEPRELSLTRPELLRGPERIETGWWDGHEVTRDYFVARDAQGVRLWIYRDRRAPKNWYVHGLFG
jgi:protein ImuB